MSLSRKTPMKQGAAMKSGGFAKVAKPPKGPKLKKCKICREPFMPRNMGHVACKPDCAAIHGATVAAKQKAKAQRQERAQDKVKREGMKTYPQLVREVQAAFNLVVRLRDYDQPCICCGRLETKVDGLGAHGWDCGHYRSTGSAPHLRFNFDNAHRQLVYCNRHGAGRAVDYRIGLIARIGIGRVEALESDNAPRKWTHDELRSMKAEFQAMARKLKKEMES